MTLPGLPVWGGVLTLPEVAREAAGAVGGPNGSERGEEDPRGVGSRPAAVLWAPTGDFRGLSLLQGRHGTGEACQFCAERWSRATGRLGWEWGAQSPPSLRGLSACAPHLSEDWALGVPWGRVWVPCLPSSEGRQVVLHGLPLPWLRADGLGALGVGAGIPLAPRLPPGLCFKRRRPFPEDAQTQPAGSPCCR